jgi:pimeloyl-ACP methyl ester carboxylesterase
VDYEWHDHATSRAAANGEGAGADSVDLRIPVDGAVLAARITTPVRGAAPALVALHGAERGLQDWYLYDHLHAVLPGAGVAAVTFDRRGEGGSTGESSRGRFELQADDALAVVEHVARLSGIDGRRIGLWGLSQGSWIGPIAAVRSRSVAFLVLVASCGVTPGNQMHWTAGFQAGRAFGDEAGASAAQIWALVLDWMRGGDRRPLESAIASGSTKEWWSKACISTDLPPDSEREEVRAELDFDPEPVFARVEVPTLLIYGDRDEWIPVDESIAAWRRARGDAVDVVIIPGAGHEPTVDGVLSPVYERTVLDWLARRR